jgi:hypothetical protein
VHVYLFRRLYPPHSPLSGGGGAPDTCAMLFQRNKSCSVNNMILNRTLETLTLGSERRTFIVRDQPQLHLAHNLCQQDNNLRGEEVWARRVLRCLDNTEARTKDQLIAEEARVGRARARAVLMFS